MAFQIKRSRKITEELQLCDENGAVAKTLDIEIDIDSIAAELRRRVVNITTAEKQLKKASADDYAQAYELYGQTVTDVFSVCFGAENTKEIIEHFGGNYIEMSVAVVPFIYEVVLPAANEAIKQRNDGLKRMYASKRRFGR